MNQCYLLLSGETSYVEAGAGLLKVASLLGDTIELVREKFMELSPEFLSDVVD